MQSWPLPKVWTQPEGGRPFEIQWSDKPRYGKLIPQPSPSELDAFYDIPTYDAYLSGSREGPHAGVTMGHRFAAKLAWTFDQSVDDPASTVLALTQPGQSLCDVGCGGGAFLQRMRDNGLVVAGIDPSPVSRKAVLNAGIEFHPGTAEDLPATIQDRRFDVVTMFQSLEHCRDPFTALRQARQIATDTGLLVVDVPNMECRGAQTYRQSWFHTDAGRHLSFFTTASLTALCEAAGFKPVKIEYSGFTRQFTPQWITAMQEVWDSLYAASSLGAPPRPSLARSVLYLLVAIVSPPRRKYDVVRVYARPVTGRLTTLASFDMAPG